jgi:hypothetical protein
MKVLAIINNEISFEKDFREIKTKHESWRAIR